MISSPNNATIRRVRRLRKRRERSKRRAFIVEGHRALRVALSSGAHVEFVFHAPGADTRHRQLLVDAHDAGARVHETEPRVLARLSSAANTPDVLAVAAMPAPVESGPGPVLVLAGVKDPADVGSLLASAAAFGVRRAVAVRGTADLYASTPVRVAAGAHFVIGLAEAPTLKDALHPVEGRIFALTDEGRPPWAVDLTGPVTLVVGDVAEGAEPLAVPASESGATPPLAIRGAIAMFEAQRQRETT